MWVLGTELRSSRRAVSWLWSHLSSPETWRFYLEVLTMQERGAGHLEFGLPHTVSLARVVGTPGSSFLNVGKRLLDTVCLR